MPWNSSVEAEYDALLAGVMGMALRGSAGDRQLLKIRLRAIETGGSAPDPLIASNLTLMTPVQARTLWLWRVAYNFYTERNNWFPWRLRNKTVEELIPLLNFGWQGFTRQKVAPNTWFFGMEGVWDDRPVNRALEAAFAMLLWSLSGKPVQTEVDLVERIIQGMRDAGWKHVTGFWDDYAGFFNRSSFSFAAATFNFDDVETVKAGECHMNANYLVARLRAFNVPAHVARSWQTLPNGEDLTEGDTKAREWHQHGHCFVYFRRSQPRPAAVHCSRGQRPHELG